MACRRAYALQTSQDNSMCPPSTPVPAHRHRLLKTAQRCVCVAHSQQVITDHGLGHCTVNTRGLSSIHARTQSRQVTFEGVLGTWGFFWSRNACPFAENSLLRHAITSLTRQAYRTLTNGRRSLTLQHIFIHPVFPSAVVLRMATNKNAKHIAVLCDGSWCGPETSEWWSELLHLLDLPHPQPSHPHHRCHYNTRLPRSTTLHPQPQTHAATYRSWQMPWPHITMGAASPW